MGVTLERVQNKFACIIGELCSEPVILSQFAIWLDLRLAEYKAKGAISLDCSGDNPDPIWLNGHRLPVAKLLPRDRHSGRYGTLNSPKSLSQHRDVSWSRLSAERGSNESCVYPEPSAPADNPPNVEERLSPVLVKEEPSDSEHVFPVSLHRHELAEGRVPNRKRTAMETFASSHEKQTSDSHSPSSTSTPKIRRVSSPADHDLNPTSSDPSTNQSLMSIISGEMTEHPQDTVDLTESDINIIMDYENKDGTSQHRENSRPPFGSPPSAASGSEYTARSEDNMNTELQEVDGAGSLGLDFGGEYVAGHNGTGSVPQTWGVFSGHWVSEELPPELTNRGVRARIANIAQKSHQVIGNVVNVVGMVGRWLFYQHGERRPVERIPAPELDGYLAEFFCVAKQASGVEYSAHRLSCMRSNLERFLKENNYPCSISKSKEFTSSQIVFKTRQKALPNSGRLQTRTSHI